MIKALESNVASNEYESTYKKILNFFQEKTKEEEECLIQKSALLRRFQHIKLKDMNDILSSLIGSMRIEEITIKTQGRPKTSYRLIPNKQCE